MSIALQQTLTQNFETLDNTHLFYATRKRALKNFKEQGIPATHDEAYKHTPIASFLTTYFDLNHPDTLVQGASKDIFPARHHNIDGYQVVLLNGHINSKDTQLKSQEQFLRVLTFQEAYQQQPQMLLEYFSKHAQSKEDPFIALNTALFEEGVFIHIADHAKIDKPLLLYHCTTPDTLRSMTYPRLLVVAGENSQASIITSWQTEGFTNAVAEVILQKGAQLDYYTLQTELGPQDCQVNTTQCQQERQSILNTYTFTWSGALVRNNLNSIIDAPYSEHNLYGLYCLRRQQHVDNCTVVDHRKPHTMSNELYKGIMMDKSTGIFNGRIYVRPEAQKTNAFQTNNNLVLSNHATLHTKPQLEIWADDVKCSHGATTGQFDEAQLFYLQTRGLTENVAQHLLRQAFANEVISKVPLATLRTEVQDSLAKEEE